ncbi:MAG: dephospho-CoA kinase [Bacteroidetes bacterium]|nr:MAG: dephospho-CoA kinase [Bacteroidota bacterium]
MLKIGITGGIGSGKTIICEIFKQLNIPVYNADNEAKKILIENKTVRKKLIENFGDNIYLNSSEINKEFLANIIFNSSSDIKKMNSIVHPAVWDDFLSFTQNKSDCEYVILEAAILIESGFYKNMDYVINVSAPQDVRIKRVMMRNNMKRNSVVQRINSQISEQERIKKSDFVIINDDKKLVLPQVLDLHKKMIINSSC